MKYIKAKPDLDVYGKYILNKTIGLILPAASVALKTVIGCGAVTVACVLGWWLAVGLYNIGWWIGGSLDWLDLSKRHDSAYLSWIGPVPIFLDIGAIIVLIIVPQIMYYIGSWLISRSIRG